MAKNFLFTDRTSNSISGFPSQLNPFINRNNTCIETYSQASFLGKGRDYA